MGYRLLETSTHKTWVNDTVFQGREVTVWFEINISTKETRFGEGAIRGGESITEAAFMAVLEALCGLTTELGIWMRVGQKPPAH